MLPDHAAPGSNCPDHFDGARILIVDDEAEIRRLMHTTLTRLGAEVTEADCVDAALERFRPGSFACVISDHSMPGRSGIELLQEVRDQDREVGIVMVTGVGEVSVARQAMRQGCDDFLLKPFGIEELTNSVALSLERRAYRLRMLTDRDHFEQLASERTANMSGLLENLEQAIDNERVAHRKTILALAQAAEGGERDMGRHIHRVAAYTAAIARTLGHGDAEADFLGLSATLHDVGKLAVPSELLTREGPLSPDEFAQVKKHTVAGGRILQGIDFLDIARQIALAHHERWDGDGYPHNLGGKDIPQAARICAFTDVWDALSSSRCYKQAWPIERCREHVLRERGKHFDPDVVDAYFAIQDEFEEIREVLGDQVANHRDASRYDLLRPSPAVEKKTSAPGAFAQGPRAAPFAPETPWAGSN